MYDNRYSYLKERFLTLLYLSIYSLCQKPHVKYCVYHFGLKNPTNAI